MFSNRDDFAAAAAGDFNLEGFRRRLGGRDEQEGRGDRGEEDET
jgi:hypothetical protein